jgi:hypothetical protein
LIHTSVESSDASSHDSFVNSAPKVDKFMHIANTSQARFGKDLYRQCQIQWIRMDEPISASMPRIEENDELPRRPSFGNFSGVTFTNP